MHRLYERVGLVANSMISTLVLGETGVGKEVMAQAIHRRSPRAHRPFIELNCGALAESLLESELFGHDAGAFTGALRAKPGLLESASGGTVLLDEVGELPASIQVKLLRVLEEGSVRRVGALQNRPIDVRFISATNQNLAQAVTRGTFRKDLFFRLAGITIEIPPLRERLSDIEPLARAFMQRAAIKMKFEQTLKLSQSALVTLLEHEWPGNVRELRNAIERAVVMSQGGEILPEHLLLDESVGKDSVLYSMAQPTPIARETLPPSSGVRIAPLRVPMGDDEKERIVSALEHCGGNQSKASKMLGISRRTLLSRLDVYSISRPRKNI